MDFQVMIDTMWVLIAGFLVFFMNLGFACVESGFARSKNTVNILSKNFIVFAVSSLGFLLLGWGIMFGDGNGFMGTSGLFFASGADNSPIVDGYEGVYSAISWSGIPLWAKFFFQLVFCGTAATIVSGAVAERVKYISFIVFSFVLTLLIYPIVGHWIWGGGFLAGLGMWDFAGGTVVHSVGGWAALAGIIVLGPRVGKYTKDGKIHPIPGHNMALATIGGIILWLGWFGFNPGSTMGFADPGAVAHIVMTTNTAGITAILTATATSWIVIGKPDLGMSINGLLAGLVAITPCCAFVSVPSSLIIGAIAGIVVVLSVMAFDRAKLDDPVGATSVHLVCGAMGTIFVGLFAEDGITGAATGNGLFFGGGATLLIAQIIGVVAAGAFVFCASFIVWNIIKAVLGARVSLNEEIIGLDIGEHGNSAYPDFMTQRASYSLISKDINVTTLEPAKEGRAL